MRSAPHARALPAVVLVVTPVVGCGSRGPNAKACEDDKKRLRHRAGHRDVRITEGQVLAWFPSVIRYLSACGAERWGWAGGRRSPAGWRQLRLRRR
ncbi:MAG: hypothetical protein JWN52_5017 [Actinomycetia bacterium]|nr:hypothetical protein [Actinomycetes bacterium]